MDERSGNCLVDIPEAFMAYLDMAIARFQVLHPTAKIDRCQRGIRIREDESLGASSARQELLHLLYRERIYSETLSMRQSLVQALTRA